MVAEPQPITPQADAALFQPVGGSERISSVDVLRGFSLLGILLMNITMFGLGIYNRAVSESDQGLRHKAKESNGWAAQLLPDLPILPIGGGSVSLRRAKAPDSPPCWRTCWNGWSAARAV